MMMCPQCRASIQTTVKYEPSTKTHLFAGLLCLMGCWGGCCLIPYCVDSCQAAEHSCKSFLSLFRWRFLSWMQFSGPSCGVYLGRRAWSDLIRLWYTLITIKYFVVCIGTNIISINWYLVKLLITKFVINYKFKMFLFQVFQRLLKSTQFKKISFLTQISLKR